jgi:hypothetical protein
MKCRPNARHDLLVALQREYTSETKQALMYWFGRFRETVLVALLAVIAVELYLGLQELRAIRAEQVHNGFYSLPAETVCQMNTKEEARVRRVLTNRVNVIGSVSIDGPVDVYPR